MINKRSVPASSGTTRRYVAVAATFASLGGLGLFLGLWFNADWADALLLGVVEGLTEFLPISSTAHLLIASDLLGFTSSGGGTFEIAIQLGAVLAILLYYGRALRDQALALPHDGATRRFWLAIVVAFLPVASVGLFTRDWIKQVLFTSPVVIGWSLILGGIVFLLVEWRRPPTSVGELRQISLRQAFGVGIAQIVALIPGVSRSGAAIIGGLLGGLDRQTATNFSFYLAIPTLGVATIVELLGSLRQMTSSTIGLLLLGTMTSFLVAWLSIGWLLRYVARHSFAVFGYYRIVAGAVVLLLVAARRL